jgi:NhaP-type Na+/H+ and K+/H+ antiporter
VGGGGDVRKRCLQQALGQVRRAHFIALPDDRHVCRFRGNRKDTKPVIWPGIVLSTLRVLLTAVFTGLFAVYILKFSILEGLLLGSIVSSTDAAAVFSILRSKRIILKQPLKPLLEFESGSNDPMAVFLRGNGILAVYLVGLMLAQADFPNKKMIVRFHDGLAWLMQIAMFVTLGLLVFPSHILPFMAGILQADTIFNIVFFIVIASILIQGTSIPVVSRMLKLDALWANKVSYPIEFEKTKGIDAELTDMIVPYNSAAAGRGCFTGAGEYRRPLRSPENSGPSEIIVKIAQNPLNSKFT